MTDRARLIEFAAGCEIRSIRQAKELLQMDDPEFSVRLVSPGK